MGSQIGNVGGNSAGAVPAQGAPQAPASPAASPAAQQPVLVPVGADSFQAPGSQGPVALSPQDLAALLSQLPAGQAGAPAAGQPGPVPASPQAAALAQAAQAAQAQADALSKFLPPDFQTVALAPGDPKAVDAWKSTAMTLVGGGNAAKVKKFLDSNTHAMQRLSTVLGVATGSARPKKGSEPDAMFGPVLAALQAAYPSAQLALSAVSHGAVAGSGVDKEIVIQMTLPTRGSGSKTFSFALNPEGLTASHGEAKLEKALLASKDLSTQFNQTLKALVPNAAKDTAATSLKALKGSAQGRMAMTLAVLALSPQNQAELFKAMGPAGKDLDLGGLLKTVKVTDAQTVVTADATSLLGAQAPKSINTAINIAGAQDGSKDFNFYKQNPSVLFTPLFFQQMMNNPTQELSATGDAVDKFVEAQLGKSKEISSQIRKAMTEAKLPKAKVTALPLIVNSPDIPGGPQQYVLFRIDTPKGPRYVDQDARTYSSFKDWRNHNQLPPGAQMTFASDGELKLGKDGKPAIETANTPLTPDTALKKAEQIVDNVSGKVAIATAAVGLVSMAVSTGDTGALQAAVDVGKAFKLGAAAKTAETVGEAAKLGGVARAADTVGTGLGVAREVMGHPLLAKAASMTGLPVGGWFAYRSLQDLYDKGVHGQTLNPLKDPTVMGDYLMTASIGLGVLEGKNAERISNTIDEEAQKALGIPLRKLDPAAHDEAMDKFLKAKAQADGRPNAKPADLWEEQRAAVAQRMGYRSKWVIHPSTGQLYKEWLTPAQNALFYSGQIAGAGLIANMGQQVAASWGQMDNKERGNQIVQMAFWTSTMAGLPVLKSLRKGVYKIPQVKALKPAFGTVTPTTVAPPPGPSSRVERLKAAFSKPQEPARSLLRTDPEQVATKVASLNAEGYTNVEPVSLTIQRPQPQGNVLGERSTDRSWRFLGEPGSYTGPVGGVIRAEGTDGSIHYFGVPCGDLTLTTEELPQPPAAPTPQPSAASTPSAADPV